MLYLVLLEQLLVTMLKVVVYNKGEDLKREGLGPEFFPVNQEVLTIMYI